MNKLKKLLSLFLVLAMLPISAFAEAIEYEENSNTFQWEIRVTKATRPITFQTMGFKLTILNFKSYNGEVLKAEIPPILNAEKPAKDQGDGTKSFYYKVLISNVGIQDQKSPSVYKAFLSTYGSDPKAMALVNKAFDEGLHIQIDSIVQVKHSGQPYKDLISDADVFRDAEDWTNGTKSTIKNMFNIQKLLPAQHIDPPTAVITRGASDKPTTSETYYEGQIIDLTGRTSFFPNSEKRLYHWEYKKKGNYVWIDGGNAVNISLPDPQIGEYETMLETTSVVKLKWSKDELVKKCKEKAYCNLIIKPNDTVEAVTVIDAPSDVILKKTETQAVIPVTLTSTISHMPVDKISKVEYILATDNEGILFRESMPPSTSVAGKKTFNIFYKGTPFTQYFKGKTIYTLKSGKVVESLWAVDGTFIRQEGSSGMPPVPVLRPIPDMVMGSSVYLDGSQSYDPDGEVVKWDFYIPTWGYAYSEDGKKHTDITTKGLGNRIQAVLGVTDNEGNYAEIEQFFKVTPPPPMLDIHVGGFLKENRKVDLMSNVTNISGFTTDDSQVTWTISPMGSEPESGIKAQTLTGKNISVLFKNKGSYLVECHAVNSANMSADQNITVNISEDSSPEMVIDAYDTVYRDENKNATITAFDNSVSLDNDYISSRTWYYAFDSDNDGSFDDETKVFLKTTSQSEDNSVSITASKVGKYKFYLSVTEGFGQPTIPIFISPQDYKTGSTEKIVEVNNYKPVVSFMPMTEKKVDLVVMTDYTGDKLTALGERLNKYVEESYDESLNVNIRMATDSKYVGRYLNEEASGWGTVKDNSLAKYEVASWQIGNGLVEYSDNSYSGSFTTTGIYQGNFTCTYTGTFPARIKQVGQINNLEAILLENGDLYVLGYNSRDNRGYSTKYDYIQSPMKLYSGIKSIVRNNDPYMLFLLAENGDVYVAGETPYFPNLSGNGIQYRNQLEFGLGATYQDINSTSQFKGSSEATRVGTKNGFSIVPSLKNIVYLKPSNGNIVARDKNGEWWGIGTSLNVYGHNTGFVDTKINDYSRVAESSVLWYDNGSKTTDIYVDAINSFVKLENLSQLDKALGGIIDVEPFKVYTASGESYSIKQTPHVEHYSDGWSVLYPFKILDAGVFEYHKIGDESPNKTYLGTNYNTPSTNLADYSPNTDYESMLKDYGQKTSWTKTEYMQDTYSAEWQVPNAPPKMYKFYFAPLKITKGIINDFALFSYVAEGTLVSQGIEDVSQERHTYHRRTGVYDYKVIGYKSEPTSTTVVGWKFYGLDADKLPNTTFRPNAEKYVIYLGERDSFQKVSPAIIDYVQKNDIKVKVATDSKYLDRRTDKTREVNLRDFITATPKGKAYDADGLETMLKDIVAENQMGKAGQDGLYLIKGEDDVFYDTSYRDLENDQKLSQVFNHIHDSTYFENGEGLSAYNNKQMAEPLKVFDKVGKYRVFHKATDQPSTDPNFQNYNKESETKEQLVYVHRRPIAKMQVDYNNYAPFNIHLSDGGSLDLDHEHSVKKGIDQVEWAYQKEGENTWQTLYGTLGQSVTINNVAAGQKINVYYRVQDIEGAWSKPIYQTIAPKVELLLKGKLKSSEANNPLTAFKTGNEVTFYDLWTSYPDLHDLTIQMFDGATPLLNQVELKDNTSDVKNTEPYPERFWKMVTFFIPKMVNGKKLEDKLYQFVVTAYDVQKPSIKKSLSFDIKTISNEAPTIAFTQMTPDPLYEGDVQTVMVKPQDADKDLLEVDIYLEKPQGQRQLYQHFSKVISGTALKLKNLPIDKAGDYKWHAVVTDTSGEMGESKRVIQAQAFGVDALALKGSWQHWHGQVDAFGKRLTNEPYRFLSLEELEFTVHTRGQVNEVSLHLAPELEAMSYKSKNGKLYTYKQLVGDNIAFPLIFGNQKPNIYKIKYIIPLADSTLTADNKRLKSPYKIYITITNSERTRTLVYGDESGEPCIDLTGNVYDHLYNQPSH